MCYAIAIYNTLQSNVIILKQTMILKFMLLPLPVP
jgi:hypothetical protein